jgi:hypothetical protein
MQEKAVRIELSPEQKEQIKQTTGKDVPAVRIRIEELEARLAPGIWSN